MFGEGNSDDGDVDMVAVDVEAGETSSKDCCSIVRLRSASVLGVLRHAMGNG